MSFADQLRAAKGNLSAREVAEAISPLLSVRSVEDWLADRRTPPEWTHEVVLWRTAQRASCTRINWSDVDWSQDNRALAWTHGVSTARVSTVRAKRAPDAA